jgi:hypothetical protein
MESGERIAASIAFGLHVSSPNRGKLRPKRVGSRETCPNCGWCGHPDSSTMHSNESAAQTEDHVYYGLHLDRLVIEQIRFVAPVLHGIQGGLL